MHMQSHTLVMSDFDSSWYKKWAKELKQDKKNLQSHQIHANKFWQNAAIAEVLYENGVLATGKTGIGFGVGQERLPALFAKHGVKVMATDQDFTTKKAGHWAKHELATSAQSLNRLKICSTRDFESNVSYSPVDMRRVPKKFFDSFEFAWSNCALGHLGSIEAGMKFIEDSLKCVKPGGVAVHTTEVNVLSNTSTSTSGDTVIFRAKDIHQLYKKLTMKGYDCLPVHFTFGQGAEDYRISMRPQFGNDYSKIQVNGHLATQVILIIRKPLHPISKTKQNLRLAKAYVKNLSAVASYKRKNAKIKEIIKSQKSDLRKVSLKPKKQIISISLKQGDKKEFAIGFVNDSSVPLFGLYSRLGDSKPIVLATCDPKDRASVFVDESWPGTDKNRASTDLRMLNGEDLADYILPRQDFSFFVSISAKGVKKGEYEENFCIVQEYVGWVEDSKVTLKIKVN